MPLPLPWTSYFDRQERVACPERGAEFNVYVAGAPRLATRQLLRCACCARIPAAPIRHVWQPGAGAWAGRSTCRLLLAAQHGAPAAPRSPEPHALLTAGRQPRLHPAPNGCPRCRREQRSRAALPAWRRLHRPFLGSHCQSPEGQARAASGPSASCLAIVAWSTPPAVLHRLCNAPPRRMAGVPCQATLQRPPPAAMQAPSGCP